MNNIIKSLRPFIGAENFELSRMFYGDIGFQETILEHNLSVFKLGDFSFYLQDAYVKDWVDNSMIFLEVENVNDYWHQLNQLELPEKYAHVRLSEIRVLNWGTVFYLHDPSGILWHVGEFSS